MDGMKGKQVYLSWEEDGMDWHGPYELEEIHTGLEDGQIDKTIYARRKGMEECHPLGVFLDLGILDGETDGMDPEDWDDQGTWPEFLNHFGVPVESSLLTDAEWRQAKSERRVFSVIRDCSGYGLQFVGVEGLGRSDHGAPFCRLVTKSALPKGLVVRKVDVLEVFQAFHSRLKRAEDSTPLLLEACKSGNVEEARKAIQDGAEIWYTSKPENNPTPFQEALMSGSLGICELLLESGLSPTMEKEALAMAVVAGQIQLAGRLDTLGFPLDASRWVKIACATGNLEALKYLAPKAANLDDPEELGYGLQTFRRPGPGKRLERIEICSISGTPLWIAASKGSGVMLQHLLASGANPNVPLRNGSTPWAIAMARQHQGCIEALENAGAFKDYGQALVTASRYGLANGVKAIVQKNLYPEAGDRETLYGDQKISMAIVALCESHELGFFKPKDYNGGDQQFEREVGLGILNALLGQGADPNGWERGKCSLLHHAVNSRHPWIAKKLVDAGAKLDLPDEDGMPPLYDATKNEDADQIILLLLHGADPNLKGRKGQHVLFDLMDEDNLCHLGQDLFLAFFTFGLSPDIRDKDGHSLWERVYGLLVEENDYWDPLLRLRREATIKLLDDKELLSQARGLFQGKPTSREDYGTRIRTAKSWGGPWLQVARDLEQEGFKG